MKNREIKSMYEVLSTLTLKGVKFSYAIARNISLLKPQYEALIAAQKASDDFIKYDGERITIVKKYSMKDDKGQFVIVEDAYVIKPEDQATFDAEVEALKEKNKETVDFRDEQMKAYNKLLEEKADPIEFYKIKLADVPEEINAMQMNFIFPCVLEE